MHVGSNSKKVIMVNSAKNKKIQLENVTMLKKLGKMWIRLSLPHLRLMTPLLERAIYQNSDQILYRPEVHLLDPKQFLGKYHHKLQ